MTDWTFIRLLRNLSLEDAIENEYIAIVPICDERVQALLEELHSLRCLVNKFKIRFGEKINLSFLIVNSNATIHPAHNGDSDFEPYLGFRNALAICSIIKAWQECLVGKKVLDNKFFYSDYFDLYPYEIRKDKIALIKRMPPYEISDANTSKEFIGQTNPRLVPINKASNFYDKELFNSILNQWGSYYINSIKRDYCKKLFRSLKIAYKAGSIPVTNKYSLQEYDAHIGLWISAFEILADSADDDSISTVSILFKSFKIPIIEKIHKMNYNNKSKSTRKKFEEADNITKWKTPQKIYKLTNISSNDLLYDDDASQSTALLNSSRTLLEFAPLLYKLGLLSYLKIERKENGEEPMFKYNFEKALLKLKKK
jgi:hypothetical protein